MFHSLYCKYCVLNYLIAACQCNCPLLTLPLPEMSIWCVRTDKSHKFQRCLYVSDLVVKCCLDIIGETWIQLLFYILVFLNLAASFIGLGSFHLWVRFQVEFFAYSMLPKRLQLVSKGDLTTKAPIFCFLVRKCPVWSTSYAHGLENVSARRFCLFFDDINFFWYLRGCSCLFFKTPGSFSHRISNHRSKLGFSNAMEHLLLSLCILPSNILASDDKRTVWLPPVKN